MSGINVEKQVLEGAEPGPHILIMGGVHGNETCGPMAIERFLNNSVAIERGKVTLIPRANPRACKEGSRYIEQNLNRIIGHYDQPASYEEHLANFIASEIDQADYLLDLHSVHAPGATPYLFKDVDDEKSNQFIKMLQFPIMVSGWPELICDENCTDTATYAQGNGRTTGVLVECGSHTDPDALERAYQTIENALSGLNMIKVAKKSGDKASRHAHLTAVYHKESEGEFSIPLSDLTSVKKGDVIAVYNNGKKITAPCDGLIFLPHKDAKIGDEWFYMGVWK